MDLTQYKFTLEKSSHDPRDFMLESIYPDAIVLPEIYDLRPQMQPVRDQGNQGTCSAQTAAAMKEWQELVDVQYKNYFSPQFVYNSRSNQESSGMTPRDTMDILFKIGIVPEKDYPYNTFSSISDELKIKAGKYKIQGYAQINTIDAFKKALFGNGPCYTAFPVYNPQNMEFWKQTSPNQQALGGHAVCCAGYLKDCFIIRNSWTTQWGDSGYTYYKFVDFGMHWELWTTIDADSNPETLKKKVDEHMLLLKNKKSLFKRLFNKKN
jgi:C1A family cysteine protease